MGCRGCYTEGSARDFLATLLDYSKDLLNEEQRTTFKSALGFAGIREWVQKFNKVVPQSRISYWSNGVPLE